MSGEAIGVTVPILGGEYRFLCQPAERDELLEAGRYLDEKMREVRDRSSKLLSLEAVAVMAAMNISHELLRQQRQLAETDTVVNRHVRDMVQKIDVVLSKSVPVEL
ncbi:MAG: cell division protein ZapA [Candidatus Competibacter sp.]|nr:cell division protein ZapA [Candidatus Competibacter sp.]HRF62414.1 cell division protein ZapA [Candidatus Competibacter sp.]